MTSGKTAAYAVYDSELVCVERALQALNQAGFENEEICVLLAPQHPLAEIVKDAGLAPAPDSAANAATLVEWLGRMGAVVIPGVGFFVRSKSFLQAWMDTERDSADCGLLAPLGIGDGEARRLENDLCQDSAVIFVLSAKVADAEWAKEILLSSGADEASCLGWETGVAMA
ncbi:MAG TPA: hypothetical protein VMH85_12480 [Terriglobales bacterium]|nr:hypothetical protein [Terriglobales bacterium]